MKSSCHLFFCLICLLVGWEAVAQNDIVEDPLKKPQIWKKLRANPNDSTLWSQYLGKAWHRISNTEKEDIMVWKQELYIQSIADKEAVTGTRDKEEDLFKEAAPVKPLKNTVSETQAKQMLAMEAVIMQERKDIKDLKKNIYENFVIIEDALRDAFAEFGVEYRYYDDTYPDRKYSEIKWIEDQENKLKDLKKRKVAEMKEKIKNGSETTASSENN